MEKQIKNDRKRLMNSMKSAEGATPNRAVRKGCYYDDVF